MGCIMDTELSFLSFSMVITGMLSKVVTVLTSCHPLTIYRLGNILITFHLHMLSWSVSVKQCLHVLLVYIIYCDQVGLMLTIASLPNVYI